MKFGVWCVVSGGSIGHREAWLKDIGGKVMEFGSQEEADREAVIASFRLGRAPRPIFSYSARALETHDAVPEFIEASDALMTILKAFLLGKEQLDYPIPSVAFDEAMRRYDAAKAAIQKIPHD